MLTTNRLLRWIVTIALFPTTIPCRSDSNAIFPPPDEYKVEVRVNGKMVLWSETGYNESLDEQWEIGIRQRLRETIDFDDLKIPGSETQAKLVAAPDNWIEVRVDGGGQLFLRELSLGKADGKSWWRLCLPDGSSRKRYIRRDWLPLNNSTHSSNNKELPNTRMFVSLNGKDVLIGKCRQESDPDETWSHVEEIELNPTIDFHKLDIPDSESTTTLSSKGNDCVRVEIDGGGMEMMSSIKINRVNGTNQWKVIFDKPKPNEFRKLRRDDADIFFPHSRN